MRPKRRLKKRPPRARPATALPTDSLLEAQKALAAYHATIDDLRLNRETMMSINYWGYLARKLEEERNQPCGGVDPRSDAVMADVPEVFMPGMHETRQAPPPELKPLLDGHNAERASVGAPPLAWNAQLEASATGWAKHLATIGRLEHSPREGRGTVRENSQQLLPGTDPEDMLDGWLEEKSDFVPGLFPDVSLSGDWQFIAHYSQMLWPGTTDLGCGVASGGGFDWLVCHYNPGGNKDGQLVGGTIAGASPVLPGSAPATVAFETHRSGITPQAAAVLDGVIEEYQRTGRAAIDMTADDDVGAEFRLDRRFSIWEYLRNHGVPMSAIDSKAIVITYDGY